METPLPWHATTYTSTLQNLGSIPVDTAVMMNLPVPEYKTARIYARDGKAYPANKTIELGSHVSCFKYCASYAGCKSWTYNEEQKQCLIYDKLNLNTYNENCTSSVMGKWVSSPETG